MAEDTIPRPIRYKFLAVAQEVCELAKVDHWEHPEVLSSLREQMETSYRAYDQAGLYKDDAEAKALANFGSPKDVARIHRDGLRGLWQRLLFNQRYSVHRLVASVLFCMLHIFLKTAGGLEITIYSSRDFAWKIPMFGWDYYVGVIVIVIIGLARLIKRIPRIPKHIVETAAFILAILFYSVIPFEWVGSMGIWEKTWIDFPALDNRLAGVVELTLYLLEAGTFFFVLAMSAAEILEISACHRAVIEAKRKRKLADAGTWALWLDNCFRVMAGQKRGFIWKIVSQG